MPEPFSNPVVRQLMNPPKSSVQALADAASGRPAPVPKGAEFALLTARSTVEAWLRAEFRPSGVTPFVAIAGEAGQLDAVRSRYASDDYAIEVAQSRHVMVLRVKGFGRQGTALQRAEGAARKLFIHPDDIHFTQVGIDDGHDYGEQDTKRYGRIDPDWPYWVDNLSWWVSADEVGFVLIKADGGPTREVINMAPEFNIKWFEQG